MYRRNNREILISTHNHNGLYFAAGFSDNGKIVRITLPKNDLEEVIADISTHHKEFSMTDKYNKTVADIAMMYSGKSVDFDMNLLEMEISDEHETSTMNSSFERAVILEVAKIPHGEVKTYKDIANSLNTQGYRAVGTAIGKNPFPIVVPCHRVIRSDGKIGGFRGGNKMKINMLINEGFKIVSGRIKLE